MTELLTDTRSRDSDPTAALPRAHGGPFGHGVYRATPEDFRVDEILEVPTHPTGAHWWLHLEKEDWNTRDVARELARLGAVRLRELGYAGLKDRHAIARQWFSIPIAALDPEALPDQLPEGLRLLGVERARHAIRRGGLKGNRFHITLRHVNITDEAGITSALDLVSRGVPNYFGAQRFGLAGGNLDKARRWLQDPQQRIEHFERGMLISAARSWLFNQALAWRVQDGSWNRLVPGEAVILDGKRSCFPLADGGNDLQHRLDTGDIHPSGPLAGVGETAVSSPCMDREQEVLAGESNLLQGLEQLGLKAERRSLRLVPGEFVCRRDGTCMTLQFTLPRGCFATAVLRELLTLDQPQAGASG